MRLLAIIALYQFAWHGWAEMLGRWPASAFEWIAQAVLSGLVVGGLLSVLEGWD